MIQWRSRLSVALMLAVCWLVHQFATSDLPNSPIGMLLFHGSAALVEFFILLWLPQVSGGPFCDDMQMLCVASIVVNFAGWVAYLAYLSPVYYNVSMWGIATVQLFRLLIVDDDITDNPGMHMVHRHDSGWNTFYSRKTTA